MTIRHPSNKKAPFASPSVDLSAWQITDVAPPGWDWELILDLRVILGLRFFTAEYPLRLGERAEFGFRVTAPEIPKVIFVHLTGRNGEDLGVIVSEYVPPTPTPTPTPTATVTPHPITVILEPDADAPVLSIAPDNNYGDFEWLYAGYVQDPDPIRKRSLPSTWGPLGGCWTGWCGALIQRATVP